MTSKKRKNGFIQFSKWDQGENHESNPLLYSPCGNECIQTTFEVTDWSHSVCFVMYCFCVYVLFHQGTGGEETGVIRGYPTTTRRGATILAGYFLMISFFYLFNQVGAWIDMICPSTIGLQLRAFVLLLLRIVAVIPVLIVFLLGKVLWSTMVGIILCDFLFVGFGTLFLRLSSLLIHKGRD